MPGRTFIIVLFIFFLIPINAVRHGVVVVPVADVVTASLGEQFGSDNVEEAYAQLAYAPGSTYATCPRLHQLLFNETVEIVEERDKEYKVGIMNTFWYNLAKKKETRGWTQRSNIRPLEEIISVRHAIPAPITPNNPKILLSPQIATLVRPLCEPIGKERFSVGTRFIIARPEESAGEIRVLIPDYTDTTVRTTDIPKGACILGSNDQTNALNLFIKYLRCWCSTPHHLVPYVWGGLSLTHDACRESSQEAKNRFEEHEVLFGGTTVTRHSDGDTHPKIGFDCSGLVLRAAQASGIPYFFKNTTLVQNELRKREEDEQLERGDLIVIPGHVMIVSDVEKNLLIDACGYMHGYGCVREIELSKVFRSIRTYDELIAQSKTSSEKEFLDIDYRTSKHFVSITLLKMRSTWDKISDS